MWGCLPPNYNDHHPWAGFTRFKEGYGGKFVEMVGSYDLVINPFIYQLYNTAYSLRQIYLTATRLL
jgi:lipid II:glycine glycyltransferase (peptidoglycan interpeptide bridge formation enzyme)